MNIGNLEIDLGTASVTLRMRHVVQGHPGCVLGRQELDDLISRLSKARDRLASSSDDIEDLLG